MLTSSLLATHLLSPTLVVDIAPPAAEVVALVAPQDAAAEAAALAAPAAPAAPEEPKWTGSVTLGATWSTGNTESTSASFDAGAERKSEDDRTTAKAYYNYSEQEDPATGLDSVTQRRAGASLKYDYFLSEKMYLLATTSAEYDRIADLDLRAQAGAGVGYQWRDDEIVKYGTEGGVSYVGEYHEFDSDESYPALRLASNLGWNVREGVAFEQVTEVYPSLEDQDDFYGKADTRLKFNLTASMYAQIQWTVNYDNTPSTGKHHTDNLVVLGLGWSF